MPIQKHEISGYRNKSHCILHIVQGQYPPPTKTTYPAPKSLHRKSREFLSAALLKYHYHFQTQQINILETLSSEELQVVQAKDNSWGPKSSSLSCSSMRQIRTTSGQHLPLVIGRRDYTEFHLLLPSIGKISQPVPRKDLLVHNKICNNQKNICLCQDLHN